MSEASSTPAAKTTLQIFKETIESLIIAFVLAFVFRAFIVEAFIIPTGSMADTLRGAHFRITCPSCAYQYNFGFVPENYLNRFTRAPLPRGYLPSEKIGVAPDRLRASGIPICPCCGTQAPAAEPQHVCNGDRILVLKYLYQFLSPKIWDVVVFKNPTNPSEHFIKRLIGRPREKVEIIDGDIYINGLIQRKPPRIQNVLWMVAFDNDYQPGDQKVKSPWQQPFLSESPQTAWAIVPSRRCFNFNAASNDVKLDVLNFDRRRLRTILSNFCAYNGPDGDDRSTVSDLKLACVLTPRSAQGKFVLKLEKYHRTYRADLEFNGRCTITNEFNGQILMQQQFAPLALGRPVAISFANIDHNLELSLGNEFLAYQGPNLPRDWGYDPAKHFQIPAVALAGQGAAFTLEHIILYRDIHYTEIDNNGGAGRAAEGNPLELLDDEFFVLGDNSPASHDSRFWQGSGLGNGDKRYRSGIVPRDYLIGKAFFVYWPSGFWPLEAVNFAFIPNIGQMRFIH